MPAASGFRLDIEIDFEAATIGRQRRSFDVDPDVFRRDISRARTFGFVADVKKLWQAGFALGSSLENSVALDGDDILNPEGLRYADEFVRHKALDALGDLSLAGAPIIGAYHAYRPGHSLNAAMLSALFADRSAYEFVTVSPPQSRRPGAVRGARRSGRRGVRRQRRLISSSDEPKFLARVGRFGAIIQVSIKRTESGSSGGLGRRRGLRYGSAR